MFTRTITCLILGTIGIWPMLRTELRPQHHHEDEPTPHQDHDDSRNPVLCIDLHVSAVNSQAFDKLLQADVVALPDGALLIDLSKPFRFELRLGESLPRPPDSVRTLPLLI